MKKRPFPEQTAVCSFRANLRHSACKQLETAKSTKVPIAVPLFSSAFAACFAFLAKHYLHFLPGLLFLHHRALQNRIARELLPEV